MSFSCRIVTPSAAAFSGSVEYASIPAHDGQLGVADGRAPLLVKLGTGLLRLDTEGEAQWFAVHRWICPGRCRRLGGIGGAMRTTFRGGC